MGESMLGNSRMGNFIGVTYGTSKFMTLIGMYVGKYRDVDNSFD